MTDDHQSPAKPQRLIVVGCGDIGSRLVNFLPPEWSIIGLNRSGKGANLDGGIQYHKADYTSSAFIQEWPRYCDQLVLTLTPATYSDEGYRQGYVESCKNVIRALEFAGQYPQRIIFVSSTSVFGEDGGSWIDETSPTNAKGFNGQRLLEAEDLLNNCGIPVLSLRCSGLYGPGRERLLKRIWQGNASGSKNPCFTNRIHVDDCAAAIAHIVSTYKHSENECLIASDDLPVTNFDVEGFLSQAMGLPIPAMAESGSKVGGKRCSNGRLKSLGFQFKYPDYRSGYPPLVSEFLKHATREFAPRA